MQKFSACKNRDSSIQRFFSTSSRCITAICPAGPPKLMNPSFSQKRRASRKVGADAAGDMGKSLPAADPRHHLRRQLVEGRHAQLEVLLLRVLDLVVADAVQALHEHHD